MLLGQQDWAGGAQASGVGEALSDSRLKGGGQVVDGWVRSHVVGVTFVSVPVSVGVALTRVGVLSCVSLWGPYVAVCPRV